MSKEEEIAHLCAPVVQGLGLELVGVEYHQNSVNPILRIYLDRAGGITMEQIVQATEQLNPLLDVADPIGGFYTLEVSSPGLDRPLFSAADFAKFQGQLVKLQLKTPLERRRKFQGLIQQVQGEEIQLLCQIGKEQQLISFNYDNVDRARLVPVFD